MSTTPSLHHNPTKADVIIPISETRNELYIICNSKREATEAVERDLGGPHDSLASVLCTRLRPCWAFLRGPPGPFPDSLQSHVCLWKFISLTLFP